MGNKNRFKTEYAHEHCHPETCCHDWNWYVIDTRTGKKVHSCDTLRDADLEAARRNAH
jgi:hypothetical protein